MATVETATPRRHETTKQIRKALRERGWSNVARVTVEAAGGVIASPRIAMAELRALLRIADDQSGGRLGVQEDQHVTVFDNGEPDRRTRTFYVYGYQPDM